MSSMPKARTAEEIHNALAGTLAHTDHPPMVKRCMIAVLPNMGAIIEQAREEQSSIGELREGVIATVSQLLVDTVLLTCKDDPAIRQQIADAMGRAVTRITTTTLARIAESPEQLQ